MEYVNGQWTIYKFNHEQWKQETEAEEEEPDNQQLFDNVRRIQFNETIMRILYAIQGTGNGHISRARDIIPYLQEKGAVDLLISGIQSDVDLPMKSSIN